MSEQERWQRLVLSADEDLVLTAWQYRMLQRDVAASKGKYLSEKRSMRDQFRTQALDVLGQRDLSAYERPEVRAVAASIVTSTTTQSPGEALGALEEAGPQLSAQVTSRGRSLLLLIDLCGFTPWQAARWNSKVRSESLDEACTAFPRLRPEDAESIQNAYDAAAKRLGAASRPWGKYALLGAAGLAFGTVGGMVAAPAIAGLYGTVVLGYSGAVATSAGLAALGGGSVASGGLGMAGGAALLAGVGGASGAGAATLGGRAMGFTAAEVAADAIRLDVVTRLVLLDAEGDHEAAKAVVVQMREKVTAISNLVAELATKLEQLRTERDQARAEADIERDRRIEVESDLTRLRAAAERLRERVGGPTDDRTRELDEAISEMKRTREATQEALDVLQAATEDLEQVA